MTAAETARRILELYWDYNIPVDIEMIAHKMGAQINYATNLSDKVFLLVENAAGISQHQDISGRFDIINGQAICSVRNTDTPQRQRFTLAHELGHFALGHGGGFRDNAASFNVGNYDQREVDANAFAAEILMPKKAVDYAIQEKNITDWHELAQLFDVSLPAMKYRLKNLNWI